MRYLIHDSGDAATLRNGQVLGDDSPLEFDDDGRAGPIDDATADKLAAMHRHVDLGPRVQPADEDDGDEPDTFDAAAFVDRTPMEDVISDIRSGAYDAHLDAIAAAEAEGRDRTGVADAIDARRE